MATKRTRKAIEAKPTNSGIKAVPRRISTAYRPQPFRPNDFDADVIAEHSDAVRSAPWLASLGLPDVETVTPSSGFRILCVMPDLETPSKVWDHFCDEVQRFEDAVFDTENTDERAILDAEAASARRRRDIAADFNLQLRVMKLAETPGFVVDVVAERDRIFVITDESDIDPATYDVVFIDANDRYARTLERCGAKRVVLVGDRKNQPHAITPTLTACYRVVADELMLRRRQLRFDWAAPELPLPVPSEDDAAVDEAILRLTT